MAKADHITPFPENINRDEFGHWLSGFTDGEATFGLRMLPNKKRGLSYAFAFFRIAVRDDDAEILQLIQSFWKCGIITRSDNRRSKIINAKPVATYGVQDVPSLAGILIPHFERCPLRAKKRNDFAIWRRGVELMASVQSRPLEYRPGQRANRHGGTYPKWTDSERERFGSLATALSDQRRYIHGATPENDPLASITPMQRALFENDD